MTERRGSDALIREVLSPQRPSTGLGVALVASVAMLFAVAGSAFIVRARVMKQRCPVYPTAPAATQWTAATPSSASPLPSAATESAATRWGAATASAATQWSAATPVSPPCGKATYHRNPDGSVIVFFTECPPKAPPAASAAGVSGPSSYKAVDADVADAMTIEVGAHDW